MLKKVVLLFFVFNLSTKLFSTTPIIEADIALTRATQVPRATPTLKTLLIICDNYINPENNNIAQGVRTDLATVNLFLNTVANRGIARVEKQVLQGRQATLANATAALKSLQTAPDDIILVISVATEGWLPGSRFCSRPMRRT